MKNTILLEQPVTRKTELLKSQILERREGLKIIICQFDDYREEVEQLRNDGYQVTELINPTFIGMEKVAIDFEIKLGERQVLYIVYEDSNDKELFSAFAKRFFVDIYKQIENPRFNRDTRIYIDNHKLFFSQAGSFYHTCMAYNCSIVAAFQQLNDIPEVILSQFNILEIFANGWREYRPIVGYSG